MLGSILLTSITVPPAELESVLLSHPDIADAAVIGVYDDVQATELPRAYIVSAKPLDEAQKAKFAKSVVSWTRERVARHKQLRGGVVVIDIIPKRLVEAKLIYWQWLTGFQRGG